MAKLVGKGEQMEQGQAKYNLRLREQGIGPLEMVANRASVMDGARYKLLTMKISLPNEMIGVADVSKGDKRWQDMENRPKTQDIGSNWYTEKSSVALKVPSVLVNGEYNFVINTEHPDFEKRVSLRSVEDFNWDPKLL